MISSSVGSMIVADIFFTSSCYGAVTGPLISSTATKVPADPADRARPTAPAAAPEVATRPSVPVLTYAPIAMLPLASMGTTLGARMMLTLPPAATSWLVTPKIMALAAGAVTTSTPSPESLTPDGPPALRATG